jgi:hypothetical protein
MRQGAKQNNPVNSLVPNRNAGRLKNRSDTMTLVGFCFCSSPLARARRLSAKIQGENVLQTKGTGMSLPLLGANGRMLVEETLQKCRASPTERSNIGSNDVAADALH